MFDVHWVPLIGRFVEVGIATSGRLFFQMPSGDACHQSNVSQLRDVSGRTRQQQICQGKETNRNGLKHTGTASDQ